MTLKAQLILLVILACGLIGVINTVRRGKLQLRYALAWIVGIVVLGVLVAIPGSIGLLASLLGIASPVNMVFFLGFVLSLAIIFVLTATLSRVTAQMRQMAQSVALMEERAGRKLASEGEREDDPQPKN
jgi:hypothetical protein